MKKNFLFLILVLIFSFNVNAQSDKLSTSKDQEGYIFEKTVDVPVTSVKNQYRSSTCWGFSALALMEAELLRETGKEYDLSEGHLVYYTYLAKAKRYLRFHGDVNYGPGGAAHDLLWYMENYGLMPEEAYSGLVPPDTLFIHGELYAVTKGYLDALLKTPDSKLSDNWLVAYTAILNSYMQEPPTTFTYEGVNYNPKSFLESTKLNVDDYVCISSFTHHPYYTEFVLELPDNWLHRTVYNVTVDELAEIADYALENGYTVNWGTDVSSKGFSWKNGVAILPDRVVESTSGSDAERWTKDEKKNTPKDLYSFDGNVIEKEVDAKMRQKDFDNWTTTDDHGMLLCGIYKDQRGNKFYKVKNSWGSVGKYDGYLFTSVPFYKMNTTSIMVNKNGIPKHIRKKLGL